MACGTERAGEPDAFALGGVTYKHIGYHRDGTRDKSQWSVTPQRERCIFICAEEAGWVANDSVWGLYTPDDAVAQLGNRAGSNEPLFVGKFVSADGALWHGYPADHQLKPQDRPPEGVASAWIESERLTKAKVAKLLQGKKCNLSG